MDTLPYFEAVFYTHNNLNQKHFTEELVQVIWNNKKYAPTHLGFEKPVKNIKKIPQTTIIDWIVDEEYQKLKPNGAWHEIQFSRLSPPCQFYFEWSTLKHKPFSKCRYLIHKDNIKDTNELDEWLQFLFDIIDKQNVWYGRFSLKDETRAKNFLSYKVRDANNRISTVNRAIGLDLEKGIPGLYWGNYFSKFYVDWFGAQKISELNSSKLIWLEGGGVFFTISDSPRLWNDDLVTEMENKIKHSLNFNAFFDFKTIKTSIRKAEPISHSAKPYSYQTLRNIPEFPFDIS